ncbi:MotA/TolQ/ExbB proton channel family protein [Leptospira meyeri]|uniref:MotA/TolQ/ExbB proton channel family protein n=1 Tax=Leptospira meyeri TaxID=29508 RepID=UPI000C2B05BD|nr:MotA/TolQ/ExbB proton channel family protein [Leptospira meyeri]PJZ80566.1 TolQ transporter [Leptospira meyeri]PJZ95696.1 TolQ transporter [Leptospira meyeri]
MQDFVDLGEKIIFLVMLFASILAIAVFIERLIVYKRNFNKESESLLDSLTLLIRHRDLKGTEKLLETHPMENSYTRFMHFVLEREKENHKGLEELMEGKILKEKLGLEERLPVLNTLGNNTPFIGLLGTVLGVIKAFYGLGTLGNSGAEVVMRSISTALLATAAGLAVAIPVVMANNYFTRKMKLIIGHLEILSKEIHASFITSGKHNQSSSSTPNIHH